MFHSRSIAAIPIWKRWFCKPNFNIGFHQVTDRKLQDQCSFQCPRGIYYASLEVDGFGIIFVNGQKEALFNGFSRFEFIVAAGAVFDLRVRNLWGSNYECVKVPLRRSPSTSITWPYSRVPVQFVTKPTVEHTGIHYESFFLDAINSLTTVFSTRVNTDLSIGLPNYGELVPNVLAIQLDKILDEVKLEVTEKGLCP